MKYPNGPALNGILLPGACCCLKANSLIARIAFYALSIALSENAGSSMADGLFYCPPCQKLLEGQKKAKLPKREIAGKGKQSHGPLMGLKHFMKHNYFMDAAAGLGLCPKYPPSRMQAASRIKERQ